MLWARTCSEVVSVAAAGWIDDLTGRIPEAIKQEVPESSLRAVTYNGRLYGMPLCNSAKHLFYNWEGVLPEVNDPSKSRATPVSAWLCSPAARMSRAPA
jgi:hypothetical protein